MNKFTKYILRLDEAVEREQKLARDLDAAVEKAERENRAHRGDRIGAPGAAAVDPDEYIAALRSKADLAEAKKSRDSFWFTLPDRLGGEVKRIRAELVEALDGEFCADPAQLDTATLALLDSGICSPDEYRRLLDRAAEKRNTTLARVIGAHAERAAKDAEHDPVQGEQNAAAYRAVAIEGAAFGRRADDFLSAFDAYSNAVSTASRNAPMLTGDQLAQFSADALEQFDALA